MKNLLKLATAAALSCTFLAAHAQQGGGKMTKKDDKPATGKLADGKTMPKDKMRAASVHSTKTASKTTMPKDGKMASKDKM